MVEGRRTYTREYKLEILELAKNSGKSQAQLERDLGIGSGYISRWKKELAKEGQEAFLEKEHLALEALKPVAPVWHVRVVWNDFLLILLGSFILTVLILVIQWLRLLQSFLLPLRLVLTLTFILFAPGYCLVAALFPRQDDLDGIERVGLSLGLSIAWIPVLALVLDGLLWGLRLWPVVVGEIISILLFSGIATWQRRRLPAGEAFAPEPKWQPSQWWSSQSPVDRRSYKIILAALTLTALALAWTFLVPTPDEFMTEFYMLGPEGLAENFPQEVAVGEELGVTLGLVNLEREARTYRVEVWAVDPWTEGRKQLVQEAGPYELAKGSSKEWPIIWRMPWAGDDQVVELLLFDGDGTEPYRTLRLWLNVNGE